MQSEYENQRERQTGQTKVFGKYSIVATITNPTIPRALTDSNRLTGKHLTGNEHTRWLTLYAPMGKSMFLHMSVTNLGFSRAGSANGPELWLAILLGRRADVGLFSFAPVTRHVSQLVTQHSDQGLGDATSHALQMSAMLACNTPRCNSSEFSEAHTWIGFDCEGQARSTRRN